MRTVGYMEQEIKGRITSFSLMYDLVQRPPLPLARAANFTGYIERRKNKRVTVGKTTIIKGVGLL
jgi:hypothetical protein